MNLKIIDLTNKRQIIQTYFTIGYENKAYTYTFIYSIFCKLMSILNISGNLFI